MDTERIWGLGKAARVLLDEGAIAGLQYDFHLRYKTDCQTTARVTREEVVTVVPDGAGISTNVRIEIGGHECAIPWNKILQL